MPPSSGDKYVKLTQLEHILKRPDTYIGSVEATTEKMWIVDESNSLQEKEITFVPGFLKIFDEILVNAADNKIRDPSMRKIEVVIDPEQGMVLVKNDGKGIPVEIHSKEKIYVPELIFGHLLTSSNYDDNEKKVVGGRNGYGAKLCNIFLTFFELETADREHEKTYCQTWRDNMLVCESPKIGKFVKKNGEYTKISFKPDFSKFGLSGLDEDLTGLLKRRVFDIAGSVKGISVFLNGEKVPVKDFQSYIELYLKATSTQEKPTIVYQRNERWEVAFCVSEDVFRQVSFVNSIATTSGGTHVNYIGDQIVNKTMDILKKKHKGIHVRPFQIRNNMFLFVNCLIENPAFTSQTKEQMITKVSSFGLKCVLTDDFIKKVVKTDFVQQILDIAAANADKALAKSDGLGRRNRVLVAGKLEDANKAGTKESEKCTLILTEGDSAKSLAVAGLKVVGRDYYGVFPLRGKLLNVRDASTDQIMKNQEIKNLKKIMGLQHKKRYDLVKGLRYGHIMIMADQDTDGSHIKGLIMNFIEMSFPGLLDIPGFLLEFITPIVRVIIKRTKETIYFYSIPEYERWLNTEGKTVAFEHKYFKGLGTSSQKEAMTYFANLDHHIKNFDTMKEEDRELFDLAFSKKKADERKTWLAGLEPGTFLDPDLKSIPYDEFINKELILFSMADNVRSIPSICDGFKPAQRKVIFTLLNRKSKKELKVSELQGLVSEKAAYHHGDQSLVLTIVALAQDYVGLNNIYLLNPNGTFGTRDAGGKDHAAARYIFTELGEIARHIFKQEDLPLLNYLKDDAKTIEPEWYIPVIPMVLVNGAEGIGTGWLTLIPQYNPLDIVKNLRHALNNEELELMTPWFRNWRGTILPAGKGKYKMYGRIEKVNDNTLVISEIPAKTWTQTVKEFIENSLIGMNTEKACEKFIQDYTEQDDMVGHKFVVTLSNEQMAKTEKIGFYERFKLVQNVNLSNMILFDSRGKLQRYDTAEDIIKDFYLVRLEYYQKRKDYLAQALQDQLVQLGARARFVKMIIDKKLEVGNRKRKELVEQLSRLKFPKIGKNGKILDESEVVKEEQIQEIIEKEEEEEEEELNEDAALHLPETVFSLYDYLLKMPIWLLTKERYEKLLQQEQEKKSEIEELLLKSAKDLWLQDLDDFEEAYAKFLTDDVERQKADVPRPRKRARKTKNEDEDFVPGAKKPRKSKKKKEPEVLVLEGEYVIPEVKEKNEKKVKKVKEEDGDGTGVSITEKVKKEVKKKIPKAVKKEETDSVEAAVEEAEVASGANSDKENDIFAKFNLAAGKFEKVKVKPQPKTKAKPKAKPKSKKVIESEDEDDDDDVIMDDAEVAAPIRKSTRGGAKKVYVMSDDEADEDDEVFDLEDDEEEEEEDYEDSDYDGE